MMSLKRKGSIPCAFPKCDSRTGQGISMFSFPLDVSRSKIWVEACKREELFERSVEELHKLFKLCELHFKEEYKAKGGNRKSLFAQAIPTIFPKITDVDATPKGIPSKLIKTDETISQMSPRASSPCLIEKKKKKTEVILPQTKSILLSLLHKKSRATRRYRTPKGNTLKAKMKYLENKNFYLKQKLKELEKYSATSVLENINLEDYKKLTYKICPIEDLAEFINTQVSRSFKSLKCRRYSNNFKNYCLSLYFRGPKLYKNCLVKTFCLPRVRTLLNFIKHIILNTGISDLVFDTLKKKVDHFQELDKLCILTVGEMSIKANLFLSTNTDKIIGFEDMGDETRDFKPALAATVIMATGLYSDWKQPVAYFLVNSTCPGKKLKEIILNIISKLNNINMTVVGVVSDMGANNIQFAKLLNISPECPYFFHNNNKIVFIFDIPYLLRALWYHFMKYKIVIDGLVVLGEFIKKFYEHDKQYSVRAAPKLSDVHISPGCFDKVKVKYAAQTFSNSVSMGLNLYIRFGKLPPDAKATEEFVRKINNLFDILNSSCTIATTKYQEAFTGSNDQKQYLLECYEMFSNLQVLNCKGEDITKSMKCIVGWKTSINGVIHLWDILETHKVKFLLTRRVTRDCLENLFYSIRKQSGNGINPTAIQFTSAFGKYFCLDMMNSETENCERDIVELLLKIEDVRETEDYIESKDPAVDVIDTDYQNSVLLQQNSIRYLIKKCLSRHSCEICEKYAKEYEELDEISLYCFSRAYNRTSEVELFALYTPTKNFVEYITSMEVLFQNNFRNFATKNNVVQEFINVFNKIEYAHPCSDFPYKYIVKLYARIRVYYTLKYVNRNFKTPNRDRKIIIWKNQ